MRTLLILFVLAFCLQACGLKGPLVLPPAQQAPAAKPPVAAAPAPATSQEK